MVDARRRAIAIATAAALFAHGIPARAEPGPKERAAESFRQARAAFARRDFTTAALAFEQAATYQPHPIAWLDAAEAWVSADEWVHAADDIDRVLDDPTTAAEFRKEAEKRLRNVARHVATLEIKGDPRTRATLDASESFGIPARKRVAPGSHLVTTVEVESTTPRRFPVRVRAGESVVVETRAAPAEPPPNAPAEYAPAPETDPEPAQPAAVRPPSHGPPAATWVAFGVSVAGAAATTIFALRTVASRDDYLAHPTLATRDQFYRQRLLTNVALGVAAAALVTGFAIWWLTPKDRGRVAWLGAEGDLRF